MIPVPSFVSWRARASCATHPEPLWTQPGNLRLALQYCGGCDVRNLCLLEGLDADRLAHTWAVNAAVGTYPVFGGLTASERAHWAHMTAPPPPADDVEFRTVWDEHGGDVATVAKALGEPLHAVIRTARRLGLSLPVAS